ncbi:MAG: 2-oxo acid dehydrogenase subunit E2 [Deltaproteobacteria bacterium]|nr:2-oxo acid dehydrogenase subunit E2 [Deltaproteobacteria bacterium]
MKDFHPLADPSSFRKMAASMWHAPNDPHIFGFTDIDMTKAQQFMDDYGQRHGCKVTVTHFVTRALALAFAKHPELNAKIGWSRIWLRDHIDIFCQVATEGGRDLSGFKLRGADQMSLQQIAEKLQGSARDIREDKDPTFKRSRNLFRALPLWGVRFVLALMSLLTNKLNLHLPKLGMPRDPFGSAMVTSVGMYGIDSGFAPFTPVARCPIILTVTRIKPRPWAEGDKVVVRPVLRLCGTFDHRVIDGARAGMFSGVIEAPFHDPGLLLTDEERAAAK